MSTAGTFCIVKNENTWMTQHLLSWLPFVDEMVLFDGNSTDGTLEIVKRFQKDHPRGNRITLVENKDPKDLRDDYVRVFNECLGTLKTDYAIFAHPDMVLDDPGNIASLGDAIAYTSNMRSFAGEPGQGIFEIKEGRSSIWKNIYRLRNPDLGLHYFGNYGADNEDCYFSKVTGNEHKNFIDERKDKTVRQIDLSRYPYEIKDSGIKILHYSDVRPYQRRLDRMKACLRNQGYPEDVLDGIAAIHPRVTLKGGMGFEFIPVDQFENREVINA